LERLADAVVEVARDELGALIGLVLVHRGEGRQGLEIEGHPAAALLDANSGLLEGLRRRARIAEVASLTRLVRRVSRLAALDAKAGSAAGTTATPTNSESTP
jgi:hypothetical protein